MFFIEWYLVAYACAAAFLLTISIWFWRRMKDKGILLKLVAGASFVPAVLLSLLASLLLLTSFGCETESKPVYSPDHSKAFRITNSDGGALGGSSGVEVISHYGFWENYVFSGYWHVVETKDVRWLDNRTLEVRYVYLDPSFSRSDCHSTVSVKVVCLPQAEVITSQTAQAPSPHRDRPSESRSAR